MVGGGAMVAVIAGAGLGLERTKGLSLGSAGEYGAAAAGQAVNNVYVNAADGNLVVQATDQFLMGLGLGDATTRTYNSQGTLSGANGALWSDADARHVAVASLTGTVNTAGSTIQRVDGDGAVITYTYHSYASGYLANEGGGAYDLLSFSSGTGMWTWTEGASQAKEVYDNANGGRLVSATDHTGSNTLSYSYNSSGFLYKITTADGEYNTLNYNASNQITSVTTTTSGGVTHTTAYYAYDTSGRLSTVTIDLTPGRFRQH